MNWQPIATAPKDGRLVIFWSRPDEELYHQVRYDNIFKRFQYWGYDPDFGYYDWMDFPEGCVLTHWLELTPPE